VPGPDGDEAVQQHIEVVETAGEWRARLDAARAGGRTVGLVPTMGALHDGHRSLIARARAECGTVAVSIFVNPLQFGDPDDIANYPRTLEADMRACAEAGADVIFAPPVREMYPSWPAPPATTVSVRGVSEAWEGASRPGHFDGVATVVAKLFSVAGPCRAYFGLKDFQQLAVVRRMVTELCLPVDVVGCPIVREADGLALSSRNVRLSAGERVAATVLSRGLAAGRAAVGAGVRTGTEVGDAMRAAVGTEPSVVLDYAVAVDADSLEEVGDIGDPAALRLLVAAGIGPVRLIDNSPATEALFTAEVATPMVEPRRASPVPAAASGQIRPRQLERIG
jgi:pantoate--beta-alanine ligase